MLLAMIFLFLPSVALCNCTQPKSFASTAISNNASLLIAGSTLLLTWNFQQLQLPDLQLEIFVIYECSFVFPKPQSRYSAGFTGHLALLDITTASINTTCTICWYYHTTLGTKQVDKYSLRSLNFSFIQDCANVHYIIAPGVQNLTISSHSIACFSCELPGGEICDTWTSNGVLLAHSNDSKGSLIVGNTNLLFDDTMMHSILTCGNSLRNISLQAWIYMNASSVLSSIGTTTLIYSSPSVTMEMAGHHNVITSQTSAVEPGLTKEASPSFSTSSSSLPPSLSSQTFPEISASHQGSLMPLVTIAAIPLIAVLTLLPAVIARRQSKHKIKSAIIKLNMVIAEHETRSPIPSITSVASHLDNLEWSNPICLTSCGTDTVPIELDSTNRCNNSDSVATRDDCSNEFGIICKHQLDASCSDLHSIHEPNTASLPVVALHTEDDITKANCRLDEEEGQHTFINKECVEHSELPCVPTENEISNPSNQPQSNQTHDLCNGNDVDKNGELHDNNQPVYDELFVDCTADTYPVQLLIDGVTNKLNTPTMGYIHL